MNPTLVLVNASDMHATPRLVTVAEAARIMMLDAADVEWSVAQFGRVDSGVNGTSWIAIDGCIALNVTEEERRAAHG